MKKYLGSKMTAYAAIMILLFIFAPLVFAIYMLSGGINGETILLALGCISCTVIWTIYTKNNLRQLYSWGYFGIENIRIRNLFLKDQIIEYEKCAVCGIGYYVHGIHNSNAGTKVYYIFFSYNGFNESHRTNMNLWKPSKTQIKVEFNEKLYDYLIEVLPKKQCKMLKRDYEKYVTG